MELAGRGALVTGAGRRLGRAIAVGLAESGCDVAIHYHGAAGGAVETAAAVRAAGRRAATLAADLRDPAAARALADRAAAELGKLDLLVNSAAIMVRQRLDEVTPDSWDATLDLNLRGAFFVAQGAAPHLARGRGAIVNIADVAGLEPWPSYGPHSISKAGVVMLTKVLARALAPDVRVNAVAPGAVLPPEDWSREALDALAAGVPVGRLGGAADVVHAVRYLASADWVTGTVLVVDGGSRSA